MLIMVAVVACCAAVGDVCAQSTKRGWAGGEGAKADASNAAWYYHWWHTKPAGDATTDANWIPLVKYLNNLPDKLNLINSYADVDTILVLNEPERLDQSDVTVAEAIAAWPQFEATGKKLIAPGVSDDANGRAWLSSFMSQATANNYRIDGVAFHWYGASSPSPVSAANGFLSRVDSYWNTYQKPVWITEFAMHDWAGIYTDQEMLQANAQFLDIVVPALESRSYVEKYSFYQWFSDATLIEGSPLTPTIVGDAYSPSYTMGETYQIAGNSNLEDVIYLRGGTVSNNGPAQGAAIATVDAIENTSYFSGSADWGVVGGDSFTIRSGATLEKTGGNRVAITGANVANSGTLRVAAGTLALDGGTRVTGSGATILAAGSVLSMGAASDRSGVRIEQTLNSYGGTIAARPIVDGNHSLIATTVLHADTTFDVEGSLTASGPLVASPPGGGGVVKRGAGSLVLAATNTFTGDTVIENGVLQLASVGSIAGTPRIFVEPQGTLNVAAHGAGGYALNGQQLHVAGQVVGSISATGGSVVQAVRSSGAIGGNLSVAASRVSVGGQGFNEGAAPPEIVGTGLTLNYVAAEDVSGDASWTNAVNGGDAMAFAASAAVVAVQDAAFPGVEAAYPIGTTGAATGLNAYFEELSPQRSRRDATFEVVFEVQNTSLSGSQILFEAGGSSRGVSFTVSGDALSFNVDGNAGTHSLTQTLAPGWHQAIGVIDVVGSSDGLPNDTMHLYIDNSLIGTLPGLPIDDWAGGNVAGVGGLASSAVAPGGAPVSYHGDVAAVRYYQDVVFTPAQVAQNFAALTVSGVAGPTVMNVNGDFHQDAQSVLEIDLESPTVLDRLAVVGAAEIAGELAIGFAGDFAPSFGDSFLVLTAAGGLQGVFDEVSHAPIPGGGVLVPRYAANSLSLVYAGAPSDFDLDGDVDAVDLLAWNNAFGQNGLADANGDGRSDGSDFLQWQRNLGQSATPPFAAVPEPAAREFLAAIVLGVAFGYRGHGRCARHARAAASPTF